MTDTMVKKQEYLDYIQDVLFCENIYNGTKTAKQYLQQFTKEDNNKYQDRKNLCSLDNYVKRTVNGTRNIIFRKPISTEEITNNSLLEVFKKIDKQNDLNKFARELTINAIRDGKTYILVDKEVYEDVETRADELGKNPYFYNVLRKNLINWDKNDNGSFNFAVIRFYYSEYQGLNETIKEEFRVFYPNKIDVYREGAIYSTIETKITLVPLIEVGDSDVPEIYDQAKLNATHLNKNSELDYYLRVASAPIPVTYMMQNEGGVVTVGVNNGLSFNAPKGEAGMEWITLKAENTEAISNRIKEIEQQMLNIAVTFATSSRVKTATQVDKEATEDESKLVTIANMIEMGINQAIELLSLYDNTLKTSEKALINRDYDSNMLTPEQWNQYRADYMQGVISWDTYRGVLEQGEVLAKLSDKEIDAEKQAIKDSGL